MSNSNTANTINTNDGRTPLGDASSSNKTAVPITNPYMANRKSKPQLQNALPAVVQVADENDTNDDKSHTQSNSAPAKEATTAKPLHPPSAPNATVNDAVSTTKSAEAQTSNEMDALQLLNLLQRDYQALEKKSIKSCLRSKHFPCPEVSQILEQHDPSLLTLSLLQSALQTLLRHPDFLGSFPELSQATTEQPTCSSLWFMTRIGTAMRFLQLLLVSKSIIDPQASAPMILGLLQTVATMMKESLQLYCSSNNTNNTTHSQESEGDDEETQDLYTGALHEDSYHAPQVATFLVAFLLRTKTLFLNHRPEFLCALWKSVESLSEPLMTTATQNSSSHCDLSIELLKDALQGLCGIVNDFLRQLVSTILTTLQNNGADGTPPMAIHPQQLKLASFFLARLATFLKFSLESDHSLDDLVLEEILSLLLCLRGLPKAALANTIDNNNNNNNNTTKALIDSCRKVFAKAEMCLSLILTNQAKRDQSNGVDVGIRSSNMKLLLGMNHTAESLASITQNLSSDIATLLLKDAFYIGKVESLSHTLQQCTRQKYPDRAQTERVPLIWTEESTVNLVLAICEHLLFEDLPMCYHLFTKQALSRQAQEQAVSDQLLDSCLRSISDALFQCATSAPCMTSNADRGVRSLHRLLLMWLTPVKNSLPVLHHPLARECVIFVVQFHATRLSHFQSAAAAATTPTTCPSFLTFLVKILFDARTFTHHRATLGVVLKNLLTAQSSTLTQQLHYGISKEYAKKNPLKCSLHNGKRGRNGRGKQDDQLLQKSWDTFTAEDVQIIGSVLALLPTSVIPNLAADVERFCLEVAPFGQGKKGRPSQLTPNIIKRALFALAFLEAVLREDYTNNTTQNKLSDVSGGKDVAEVQHDIIAWFLYLWNKEFSHGKRKHGNQKRLASLANLGRSIVRLVAHSCNRIGAFAGKAGSCLLTQQQMQCVLKLLQICTGPSLVNPPSDSPVHEPAAWPYRDISLARLVWEASGLLGNIVKQFPETNVDGVLQGLVEIFQNLLGSDTIWSFQAHTIGSLHSFSQFLPKSHAHLLSTCIRKKKQKSLLQCRIQGFAFEYEKSIRKEGSKKKSKRAFTSMNSLFSQCSRDLESLSRPDSCESMGRLLLSTCTGAISPPETLSIALGSYFLTMPTQDGRKAIVIFPPEESSLQDIQFMMGSGEDAEGEDGCSQGTSNLGVQRLRHVSVSGGSCKMMLDPARGSLRDNQSSGVA